MPGPFETLRDPLARVDGAAMFAASNVGKYYNIKYTEAGGLKEYGRKGVKLLRIAEGRYLFQWNGEGGQNRELEYSRVNHRKCREVEAPHPEQNGEETVSWQSQFSNVHTSSAPPHGCP